MHCKRLSFLVIPVAICLLSIGGATGLVVGALSVQVTVYLFLASLVLCYTAKEAVSVQTMNLWGEDLKSLPASELDRLAVNIARDFCLFGAMHVGVYSILFVVAAFVWSAVA